MTGTLPVPRLIDPSDVPPLRWGIIGTGWIATRFTRALHTHTTQRIVAVAARSTERSLGFAAEHDIEKVSPTAEALVSDPSVDVVYIATPHSSHREFALLAIAAGKHVLVEKPFAMSAVEAGEIVAAARAASVFAMEAMWTRYLPQTDIVRQLLADGALGDVHLVTADFGFSAPFDPSSRMWDPALGGGALLDAGVYPISFASFAIGEPRGVRASGAMTSTGVDARAAVLLETASGAQALLATSMVSKLPTRAMVIGSEGRVEVMSSFFAPSGVTLTEHSNATEEALTWVDDTFEESYDALSYQANALASYVAAGLTESPLHSLDETVSVLATIDEARAQVLASARPPVAA
ncbi:putative dehydrogenase [Kribbella sp. VKM Ac-2527]|uniref:Putative dehydrogenase n=1 Tax=Kribbella caucasensis TaxID=2512215 RepID=A0A4R6KJW2_9ACTN|nr:Gfo/Idh/MocA family oxidoreductase [Kribbella sp. VKM Ac-2527]TDO51608.1 putative dehydrogenase [Kribbella sp. VKM Ac-2527]